MTLVRREQGTKIHVYLELLRPFTLLAPFIVSSCVIIAGLVSSGRSDLSYLSLLSTVLSASLCFVLLNGASNALNQATDWREDALSKPYRPVPRGRLSVQEAYTVSVILYGTALLLSFTVHLLFSLFVVCIACFSITYSVPPRMKRILLVNQLWVALPRGFLGIVGSWSVFGNPFDALPLAIGGIAALFLFGGTATKDIVDAEADRAAGTRTLVNVFGVKPTACVSVLCMVSAFGLIIPLVSLHILADFLLPLTFLCFFSVLIGWLMVRNHRNTTCENTSAWTLMYATYFIFALSFAVFSISFSVVA
ncbi:MAG: UbiA prenyltransferase family protein [Candidatus Thermoplasmatota archaeon]|nr:UbiA prenyltransferase family protein [Candidatus Thermoplasmatota archaeon]